RLVSLQVKVGDKLSEGDVIGKLEVNSDASEASSTDSGASAKNKEAKSSKSEPKSSSQNAANKSDRPSQDVLSEQAVNQTAAKVHAGPAVRKLARELGANLSHVAGSGPKGRILKDDLKKYVKTQVARAQDGGGAGGALPAYKLPDFSQFGDVEFEAMDKIQRITASNMVTSWLNVPHVTQFDEADITELEAFRKAQKAEAEKRDLKLTPMPFLLKACARVLVELPQFNVSLDMEQQRVVKKKYVHIGMAVDTPNGLVVPVIRDVDQKSIWQLAQECMELADRAKNRKLSPAEMQGGCFTISSLGGIGGTAFTPIVNVPEVAILGVSKAEMKPRFNGNDFDARLMLPLSLSYDHRAINGADAARFTGLLGNMLGDIRLLLM
ncbi:MAG: 2-oxo acid dehydrogenase subunit E2, partial [Oleiphilaceae bacterium]|nr:2-oxo acid dehydrogenase subunit E2 [Oleiphilaceae bacterium]